jgi:serine carboxypeptidase-like clade 4
MRNLEVGIPALLEDGISLLVYAGEYDLICNWLGMLPYLISVWKYFKMSYLGRTFMVCIDEFSPDV